jgi:hypothetical protein
MSTAGEGQVWSSRKAEEGMGREACALLERTQVAGSRYVIHLVDVAALEDELRPVCGAWGEEVTWTTIPAITTCPQCALAVLQKEARGSRPAARPRASS